MTKVVYDKIGVVLREREGKHGPMTAEDAKELLGYEIEEGDKVFGDNYLFRDVEGNKVRLNNVPTNRPFRMALAKRYMNEQVRKKWKLNGETIIVDRLGHIQSGQHRLVGLVLAEQLRKKNVAHYKEHFGWRTAVDAEMLIVTGVSEKADTVDSIDLGQKRSLGDVFYRRREFKGAEARNQQQLANILAGAVRLVWIRSGGQTVSDAKHFPHSEALDFLEAHPKINDAVAFIFSEQAGSEKRLAPTLISLGYAAGLMYLMAAVQTDPLKWMEKGVDALNLKGWVKAEEFWSQMAAGEDLPKGSPILLARNALARMSASGSEDRDEKCGVIVKAFNLWIEGKKGEPADVKVKRGKNESGKMVLVETPRLGGIDFEREPAEAETAPEEEETAAKSNGKAGKKKPRKKTRDWTGEWAWVHGDDGWWKGKVKSVSENGKTATVEAAEDHKDYEVPVLQLADDKGDE